MPSSARVALITGCGKPVGIGNSTARALAAAEAGTDRVDKDEIGKAEPSRRVVDEANRRDRHGAAFRSLQDLRAEPAEMQKD